MTTAASGFACTSAADSNFVKTVTIDSKRHNPCVGAHYGETELGKLLVVGMSHYGTEEDVGKYDCTEVTIRNAVSGKWHIPYFRKIAQLFRSFLGDECWGREFYSGIGFYNYLPRAFERAGMRVAADEWHGEDAREFFFKVLDQLKPNRVLLTGQTLWRFLPSRRSGSAIDISGSGLRVPFDSEDDGECCWYRFFDMNGCLVGAIPHPSWPTFARKFEEIRDSWVPDFMKIQPPN